MDAFESEFARRLMAKITEEYGPRAELVLKGSVAVEDYKAKSAYLQALRDVQGWMAEVRDELTQPEDDGRPRQERKPMRQTAGYSGV